MRKKAISLMLVLALLLSLFSVSAIAAEEKTVTFEDADASLFEDKARTEDILAIYSALNMTPINTGNAWSISGGKLTVKPYYTGNNTNTTQVQGQEYAYTGAGGGYNSLSAVIGLVKDPGLIQRFSFTTSLAGAGHESLLVLTSYQNSAVYDAVAVSGAAQMRKYTRVLSGSTVTVTQYENASGVQLYTDEACTQKETAAFTGDVTVCAEFKIIEGTAYYCFTLTKGSENRYFRCEVSEMLTNVYFSVARKSSASVDDLSYTVFGGFEDGTALTEAEAGIYYAMATKYPGAFTGKDMDKIYTALGVDGGEEGIFFYDGFATADNWECINPYAHQEKSETAVADPGIVENGQLKLLRIASGMDYGYIYRMKDTAYDGSPIYKASFRVKVSGTDNSKGFGLITSFTDINNFSAVELGDKYGGGGYRLGINRTKGAFSTGNQAWMYLSKDKVSATIADGDKLSNNGFTATSTFGFENGVTVTMEWDSAKGHYIIAIEGTSTVYLKGGDKLLTNLYFSNFDANNPVYIDDVMIYRNESYGPVYRKTNMSTLESGNTNFKYTVSQNGVQQHLAGIEGAEDIRYGITYIYRSATVQQMQSLAGKANFSMERSVASAAELPLTYTVTVNYEDASIPAEERNPGKRVTVLPYVRYTPAGGGEPVYLWAGECASVSPAGFMKKMLSAVVDNSLADIQYSSLNTKYRSKIQGSYTAELFQAVAASENQAGALAAMNTNGYSEATPADYYALLNYVFSDN